ncbi:hypothetical protein TNCV_3441601 [Trichonephila clavipes]|nr:hypothetical protein TNCV_3441601 [Trichonephila clavipes]
MPSGQSLVLDQESFGLTWHCSLQTKASGRRISATTVRNRLQCRSVCKKTSCVRSPQRTTAKEIYYAGQENMFLGRKQWASVLFTDESDLQWMIVIQGLTDLETAHYTINPTLLKDTVIEVVESGLGRDLKMATLTCMCSVGTATGLRYRDEI